MSMNWRINEYKLCSVNVSLININLDRISKELAELVAWQQGFVSEVYTDEPI